MTQRIITMRYGQAGEAQEKKASESTPTLLWSNPDPTAGFAAQDITLSKPASNYDALQIVWRESVGDAEEVIINYEMDEMINLFLSGTGKSRLSYEHYASTYRYERSAYFTNEDFNILHFYNAIRVVTSSSNVGSLTTQCIPVEIYGIKGGVRRIVVRSGSYDTYAGPYDVVPLAEESVVMSTANKLMSRNVIVQQIPYYETSNVSGGYTAYIAGEVETDA